MRGIVKGSFSVSTSSTVVVAMILEGEVKKGDRVSCPLTDGSSRILVVKATEAIAPSDPQNTQGYPIALIVESLKPAEAALDREIFTPETPGSIPKEAIGTRPLQASGTPQRKIS